jgi:hypothetical protein
MCMGWTTHTADTVVNALTIHVYVHIVCLLGIAGFYRGVDANVMRAMVRTVNYKWIYDLCF